MKVTLAVLMVAGFWLKAVSADELQVEADWKRHDEQRLAQIREPGSVWFGDSQVDWPGVKRDKRLPVPQGPALVVFYTDN